MWSRELRCGVLALATVVLISSAAAQQFPRLQEDNLAGQQVVLPDAAAGKIAVMILGFTRSSQKPTEAWAKRAYDDFGKNPGFVLYQLPVIEAAPRLVRGMISSGMKKGVPETQRPFFVPVMRDEAELKKLVNYKEADDAYIVVLDRTGAVVYQTHGGLDASGYSELQAKVQNLLK